jgi:cob(I)alamin adenosyltransferase
MTAIYTRTGDSGTTGLANGTRTTKTSARIEAIGAIDECNAHMGLLISLLENNSHAETMLAIQHLLFELGASLAVGRQNGITNDHVKRIELDIDALDQALPTLTQFILPGGSVPSAQAHVTRTVCRRAERRVFLLAEEEHVPEAVLRFLNRLSDYLFVVARTLSAKCGGDIHWLAE